MKKLYALAIAGVLLLSAIEAYCSPVLISVELPTIESKKAWHHLDIPTYELMGNTAIAEVDEARIPALGQQGYQITVIDRQPDLSRCMMLLDTEKFAQITEKPLWQSNNIAIIRPASKGAYLGREYAHRARPMNTKTFGDRFWKSVTTKYASLKSISYDPLIQNLVDQVNTDSIASYIQRLQDFGTRFTLLDSSYAASEWIANKLSDWGYTCEYDSFYINHLVLNSRYSYIIDSGYTRNVIATKEGCVYPECINIISGHYDTAPYIVDTTNYILNFMTPGADDNASGTAGSMEVSRILAKAAGNSAVRFCAWAAEEQSMVGSRHYANYADSVEMDIVSMFNMDMIGYGTDSINCGVLHFKNTWILNLASQVIPIYVDEFQYRATGEPYCDEEPFWGLGYTTMSYQEQTISPYYHNLTDSLKTLNPIVFTKHTKAAVAMMAIFLCYPQPVDSVECTDLGDGSSLVIDWQTSTDPDVVGYRIYYGKMSNVYSDTVYVPGRLVGRDTIAGLMADSTFYFAVTACDSGSRESYMAYEFTGIPRSVPLMAAGLAAIPVDSGIVVNWRKSLELDIEGYNVYRSVDLSVYDSLTYTADTFWLDKPLSGANRYYYKVQATDKDCNRSPMSDSIYCRPITLDQGILVVDETNNWTTGSMPRDAQQDSFYNYIFSGYKNELYEYGLSAQKPILADFGPYSTVAWLADDYTTMLASGAVNDMRSYLDNGGKLWLAGWKPSGNLHNSITYPADYTTGDVSYDHFKITHAELSGTTDSFKTAVGIRGYPDITIDTLKYPSTIWGKTLRSIEALMPLAGADTIYVMNMKNNDSPYEGRACAVRDSGKTVFFGFPLYYMDKEQARLAAQKVMAEFGEVPLGVTGKPGGLERITDLRLSQNSPNPFNQQTDIRYQLPKTGLVSLNIYNIAGQLVRTLVKGNQAAGSYVVKWDRLDSKNRKVSAGVYIYHLSTDGKTQSRKMVVLK